MLSQTYLPLHNSVVQVDRPHHPHMRAEEAGTEGFSPKSLEVTPVLFSLRHS